MNPLAYPAIPGVTTNGPVPQPQVTLDQAMAIAKTAAAGAVLDAQRLADSAKLSKKAESAPKVAPINLPRNGKSVFAWAKLMENTFGAKLMPVMAAKAKSLGYPSTVGDWNESQTKVVSLFAAGHCTKSANYRGQFDHLASEIADSEAAAPIAPPKTTGVNVADLRKELVNKMKALIAKQTGRDSTVAECKAMFKKIAPQCQTSTGHTGVVPESLANNSEATWIGNMIRFVDEQIAHVADSDSPESAEMPI